MRRPLDPHPLLHRIRVMGGATFDPHGEPADPGERWLFPLHPGKTLIVPESADWEAPLRRFVEEHRPLLEQGHPEWRAFGAWIHPAGDLYLDIVTGRLDREEARREALEAGEREGRRIVALFQASSRRTLTLVEDA